MIDNDNKSLIGLIAKLENNANTMKKFPYHHDYILNRIALIEINLFALDEKIKRIETCNLNLGKIL